MAFDEWMLHQVMGRPGTMLARLYTWWPGAITIGRHQSLQRAVDTSQIGDTSVVRRITGGRALYHDTGELTYAVAMNLAGTDWSDLSGSVASLYGRLAGDLARFLTMVGCPVEVVRSTGAPGASSDQLVKPCFASTARYEMVRGEEKIVASAQRQIGDSFLQHGAIKLRGTAVHPALRGVGETGLISEPLARERFDALVQTFADTVPVNWNTTLEITNAGPAPDQWWRDRLKKTSSNPLARRDTIEQPPPPKSL